MQPRLPGRLPLAGVLALSGRERASRGASPLAGTTAWAVGSRNVTVKLVVLYTPPDDPDFDRQYLGTHMPLVHAIPGLQRAESGRIVTALDGGEQTYYRMAELYFADQAALGAAFGSDEGQVTAADYQKIAPPGSRMYVQNVDE